MNTRHFLRLIAVMLLVMMTVMPASGQYGRRGDKRYRDRYTRADTYGDVVEIRWKD